MSSRVVPLREAVSAIADGSQLALTGFAITRNGVAVAHELIRAGRKGLRLTQVIGGLETDLLVAGGCVDRLVYSGGSLDRFGSLQAVNRAALAGRLDIEEYSSLALLLRLHAGALGLPHVSTRSMLGSELLEPLLRTAEVRVEPDPFTGHPVLFLAPLRPTVAVVHTDVADEEGNAALSGPTWAVRDTAFAAERVLVITEELVAAGDLPADQVAIPAAIVHSVSVVPRGAHPTAVYGKYDFDRDHLKTYVACGRAGEAGSEEYLDRYILGVADHAAYLHLAASSR